MMDVSLTLTTSTGPDGMKVAGVSEYEGQTFAMGFEAEGMRDPKLKGRLVALVRAFDFTIRALRGEYGVEVQREAYARSREHHKMDGK